MLLEIFDKYKLLSSEIIIFLTIIFNFIGFFFTKSDHRARFTSFLSIIGLSIAAWFLPLFLENQDSFLFFNQLYLVNRHNTIVKLVLIIGVILAHLSILLIPKKDNGIHKFTNFELPLLINFSLLGTLLVVSSNNLLILYLSLELQAFSSYILTVIKRDSEYSVEGGVKYFVLGALSSAICLYGISLIYISLGTMDYERIADLLMDRNLSISSITLIGIICVFFGLMFKLAAAPLHTWIADVYQSIHSSVLKFFSVVPKVAVVYAIYVLYHFVFVGKYFLLNSKLIAFFAFCSFIIGTIGAVKQTNFRRLLAYSTVANTGFFLLNVLGDLTYSFIGLVIYSIAYIIGNYGLISFSSYYWDELRDSKNYLIDDLSGLAKKKSFLAIAVSSLLLSIAGIPPFIGFFGKFYVLLSSMSSMHFILALVGIISTVISLIYYVGIIKAMYFKEKVIGGLESVSTFGYCSLTILYGFLSIGLIFCLNSLLKFLL